MTSRFTQRGGGAALLGGALWLVVYGAVRLLSADLAALLALPAPLLIAGLAAVHARQAGRSGVAGLGGLVVGLVGAVLLGYGSIGRAVLSGEILGFAYGPIAFDGIALGAFVFGIGTALVAAAAIAADVLPRLSPVPLLAGALGVAIAGGLGLLQQVGEGSAADVLAFELVPLGVMWATFGIGWGWLGYLLWSERPPHDSRG